MKYKILLKLLKILVYFKRFFWWLGPKIGFLFLKISSVLWRPLVYLSYKTDYLSKKLGVRKEKIWWLRRDNLQLALLLLLFFVALPQTKLFAKQDSSLAGKKSIAYGLFSKVEEFDMEEIQIMDNDIEQVMDSPSYRNNAVFNGGFSSGQQGSLIQVSELGTNIAGGLAITKPIIIPGATIAGENRQEIINYIIKPGDSLSSIAYNYNVSINTIMWSNNMTLRSIIRPGDTILIPPVTGVVHTIKSGDTLGKLALKYAVDEEKIIKFNMLADGGKILTAGEKIMIPDGIMPQTVIIQPTRTYNSYASISTPANSNQAVSVSGFVWPSAVRTITQYYSWRHAAIDIAGPLNSANYATKSGTVEVSQCGWNGGYGCYIIINHGGGVKTLYAHNNKILVSVGDYVNTGQTIGLMGNTGNVRGVTGIHLHFEIIVNGAKKNPLGYVR
jgi:murein DD-endopeptidase MepM/ murein hydrolase activator NlpD